MLFQRSIPSYATNFFMTLASGHYFIFQTGLMPASLIINLALIVISLESDFDVEKQIF